MCTHVYVCARLYIGAYTGWNSSSKLLRILRHNDTLFRFLFCQTARELAAASASLPIGGNMAQSASYDLLGPLLFFIPRIKKDLNVSFALQRVPSSLPPRLAPFSSLSSPHGEKDYFRL